MTAKTENMITDKKHVEAIKKAIGGSREVFSSLDEAITAVQNVAKSLEDAGNEVELPYVMAGVGDLSSVESLDEVPWKDAEAVVVATLGVKLPAGMAVRAIMVYPTPTVEAVQEVDGGPDWLAKIAEKEFSLVSARALRSVEPEMGASALYEAAKRMPVDAATYVEENRRGGIDTSAIDKIWQGFRASIKSQLPALDATLPRKADVIRCIRSAAAARAEYPDLEQQKIFVFLAETMAKLIDNMDDDELDSREIRAMIAGRDTLDLTRPERQELAQKIDLSAFTLAG
jgi:hypothetical protein